MKHGRTALLASALTAALLVPAAVAKPGNGHGNGHGPPAWAGGGHGGAKVGGKPDTPAKAANAAERAARKAERRAARAPEQAGEDAPKHENPAWTCKFERQRMGGEAFAVAYGTNESRANAFGKCVSREAHERDGVTFDEEENPAPVEGETSAPGDTADGDELEDAETLAAVRAFFDYLWPFM